MSWLQSARVTPGRIAIIQPVFVYEPVVLVRTVTMGVTNKDKGRLTTLYLDDHTVLP